MGPVEVAVGQAGGSAWRRAYSAEMRSSSVDCFIAKTLLAPQENHCRRSDGGRQKPAAGQAGPGHADKRCRGRPATTLPDTTPAKRRTPRGRSAFAAAATPSASKANTKAAGTNCRGWTTQTMFLHDPDLPVAVLKILAEQARSVGTIVIVGFDGRNQQDSAPIGPEAIIELVVLIAHQQLVEDRYGRKPLCDTPPDTRYLRTAHAR